MPDPAAGPAMRIAYLIGEPLLPGTGISRKIDGQVGAWRALGHDVETFALRSPAGGVGLIRAFDRLCRELLATTVPFDVVYFRQNVVGPRFLQVLRRWPVVMEVNSDDVAEAAARRRAFRVWQAGTRSLVLHGLRGLVAPTQEIAARPHLARHRVPQAVVSNGIDLAGTDRYPVPKNDRPRAVFTYTSPAAFPAVDLVVRLAQQLPGVDFDVVGPRREPKGPPTVTWHGPLQGAAYDDVVRHADVGIGSLGLHRIGLTEGCTLKVRGYLAAGIPAVIAHRDVDFPAGAPFLLELSPTEAIEEHAGAVTTFIDAVRGSRVAPDDVAHLDTAVKERQRMAFVESVL